MRVDVSNCSIGELNTMPCKASKSDVVSFYNEVVRDRLSESDLKFTDMLMRNGYIESIDVSTDVHISIEGGRRKITMDHTFHFSVNGSKGVFYATC